MEANQANTFLEVEQRQILLQTAKDSVLTGLETSEKKALSITNYPNKLQQQRASFVTLNINHQLRGCIGSLNAYRPLVEDVNSNAFAAAFSDPRFPAVTYKEYLDLDYHISILSPSTPMVFNSEQELLSQLQPNIDGLILTEGHRKSTFLPSVWEQLDDKKQFLNHLKQKAGLSFDYWSETIQISRYTVESFSS